MTAAQAAIQEEMAQLKTRIIEYGIDALKPNQNAPVFTTSHGIALQTYAQKLGTEIELLRQHADEQVTFMKRELDLQVDQLRAEVKTDLQVKEKESQRIETLVNQLQQSKSIEELEIHLSSRIAAISEHSIEVN